MAHAIIALVESYATDKRSEGASESTIKRVQINVRDFARTMKVKYASELTTQLVKEWGSLKREDGKSQSAVYAYYNSVRSFLHYLEDEKINCPAERAKIHCKPNYQRMVVLRAADVGKIAAAAHSYEVDVLIRLLYCTGMRLSEALAVNPDDFRHDGTIYINGKWCISRHVVLWPGLREELEKLAPEGGPCFRYKRGPKEGEIMSRGTAHIFIKRAMVRASEIHKNPLYAKAYPHSLRHTNATEQLRGGASTEHVARQLGHKKLETTRKYLHLITDDIVAAHDKCLPKL